MQASSPDGVPDIQRQQREKGKLLKVGHILVGFLISRDGTRWKSKMASSAIQ
jgi:hypothetical protein